MPSSSAYSLRAHTVQTLTGIKRPDVPLRVVLRNTAAVVLPLAVGVATGHSDAGLGVAVGALNTMFSDQPGPYRQRLRNLLLATTAAALASLSGFLIGAHLLPMLLVTAAFGFGGGMLVVFGADNARVGMTSIILLVVTAATPAPLAPALAGSGLIFVGGLLLTAFSLAAWPLQRYWPERQALSAVYAGLGTFARQGASTTADVPALTEAMTTLQQTLLGRHHAHGRAMEAFGVLLELAERIRLELTAMGEWQSAHANDDEFRRGAARVLSAIADALAQGAAPELAQQATDALRAMPAANKGAANIHRAALLGQLAAAARNADWAGSRGELRASAADARLPEALRGGSAWATLRANLTPRSVAFRHAMRTAACLCVAVLGARALHLPHGYWLPMTAAIVLRPDFAATFKFGLLRVLGTVLGLVLTTVLLHVTPAEVWAHLALMAALCMTFRYLATAHYGIAVAALTGTVVILLSFDGVAPGAAVLDRTVNTALGCGLALLAYVVWPTWERGRARAAMATMLEAYASYLAALAQPTDAGRGDARTAARTARSNVQASLERMRSEPATPLHLLDLAQALFANGNRLARSAMSVEAWLDDPAPTSATAPVRDLADTCAQALREIAGAVRVRRAIGALPDLRAAAQAVSTAADATGDATPRRLGERLVDNVATLAHVVSRSPIDLPDIPLPPRRSWRRMRKH
ncbi:MAG: FUSC family protein [Rhodanobacter sp.]